MPSNLARGHVVAVPVEQALAFTLPSDALGEALSRTLAAMPADSVMDECWRRGYGAQAVWIGEAAGAGLLTLEEIPELRRVLTARETGEVALDRLRRAKCRRG